MAKQTCFKLLFEKLFSWGAIHPFTSFSWKAGSSEAGDKTASDFSGTKSQSIYSNVPELHFHPRKDTLS